jgi:hypothetical protein
MEYPVQSWTLKPADDPSVHPDNFAYAAELECGHAFEIHTPKGNTLQLPSHVVCAVCQTYLEQAEELEKQ